MAQLLEGGRAAVHALLYGDVHPGTQQYFESQRGNSFGRLTESARRFATEAVDRFGFMASEATQRMIHNVRRKSSWAWHGDYIRPLTTVDQLQVAAPTMMRMIMANPMIRRKFYAQQLAGYDGQYVDLEPNKIGEEHYEYRRVMDGIIVETVDENGEAAFESTTYFEDLRPDDTELTFLNQLDILNSWGHAMMAVSRRKKDPTSLYNASLD